GAAPAPRVHVQPADRVGHGVERGTDARKPAEPVPRLVVGELDLQDDAEGLVEPVPLLGAVGHRGLDQRLTVRVAPLLRREAPVTYLDRPPRHRHATSLRRSGKYVDRCGQLAGSPCYTESVSRGTLLHRRAA